MGALERSETWSDAERRETQSERLRAMAAVVLAGNSFYKEKLAASGIRTPEQLLTGWRGVPFTNKSELSADQAAHPPWGRNLTYPIERYVRMHQTSGTTGRPLRVLDTAESWQWWADAWRHIYRASGVTAADRVFFAFSFGPFIGFWSAFAGAESLGALCISGGAQTTTERLATIAATNASVLLCTPTYALRLAEAARAEGIETSRWDLRLSIHAGEPGASVPATRERIESALGVKAIDHTGASEVGPTGFSCEARDGVHLIESEFIAEVLEPASGEMAEDGEGELVLTNLGRWGWPAIRYRTGDRVRLRRDRCSCGRTWAKLEGGILGRADDMVIVRGVNVYPSAIEAVLRGFEGISEYRVEAFEEHGMIELRVMVEPGRGVAGVIPRSIAEALHRAVGVRCAVELAAPGSLPRFELKATRFVRVSRPAAEDPASG